VLASTLVVTQPQEAALDEHLQRVAYRNARGATLFIALFALALWPTDLFIFRASVLGVITWLRASVIATILLCWVLMRTPLGPRHPTLILAVGGTFVMLAVGVGFGALGGPSQPWIFLSFPALFFSVLAPVRLRHRVILVVALTVALLAGFLLPYPQHWRDPMSKLALSYVASLAALAIAVGHLSFRILRQSFYQSLLTEHLERVREDERARISRELHDELGQELTALHLALSLTQQRFGREPQSIGANLSELTALVQRTQTTTRNLVSELRPRMLDELGLAEAIAWLMRQTEERAGLQCTLAADDLAGLPAPVASVAFRVVQEALTNVSRHAKAKTVSLGLRRQDGALEIAVSDDGVGMPRRLPGRGFGLIGIGERVSALGGTMSIESRSGGGTTLRARIPILEGQA
jgi:signal transduction histidine kinase